MHRKTKAVVRENFNAVIHLGAKELRTQCLFDRGSHACILCHLKRTASAGQFESRKDSRWQNAGKLSNIWVKSGFPDFRILMNLRQVTVVSNDGDNCLAPLLLLSIDPIRTHVS
jgi:hypothetical protein